MAVTQKEIALHLGLSRSLVGEALNGNPRVADETRHRIQETARHLGYNSHSNREARVLIARRYGKRVQHGVIALLFPGAHVGGTITGVPFFKPIIEGMEIEAREKHCDLLLCAVGPDSMPRLVRESAVDGVIGISLLGTQVRQMQDSEIPVVLLSEFRPNVNGLRPDDRAGMALAVRHLAQLGHRRIAYAGLSLEAVVARDRLQGYRDGLDQAGMPYVPELVEATAHLALVEDGIAATRRLLARTTDFSALACYHDLYAMGAVRALQEHGLRVPHDVSVTGFDDVSTEHFFEPAITSVRFDRAEMGRQAVRLIFNQMERDGREVTSDQPQPQPQPQPETAHEVLPVELVQRSSTQAPSQ